LLTNDLVRFRRNKGNIFPLFAKSDKRHLELINSLIKVFYRNIGKKKYELTNDIRSIERDDYDFKLVRGLAFLLERNCKFVIHDVVKPEEIRRTLFKIVNTIGFPISDNERKNILLKTAESLNTKVEEVESSLYADLDDELILKEFIPIDFEIL